jgi:type III secretory pathway lipoprotein EscJ
MDASGAQTCFKKNSSFKNLQKLFPTSSDVDSPFQGNDKIIFSLKKLIENIHLLKAF